MTAQTDGTTLDAWEAAETRPLATRLGAELLGTFLLLFGGLGVALYGGVLSDPDPLAEGLGFGVALLAAVALFVTVSGAHFNPALSLAAAITGRISWADLLPYWLAQLIGGVGSVAVLYLTTPSALPAGIGLADVRELMSQSASGFDENSALARASGGAVSTTMLQVFIVEAVATALFVAIALGVTRRRGATGVVPVAVGLGYGVLSMATLTVTGGALNPARASAVAIFSESWALGQLWVFWVAPLLGAALAGLLITVFAPEEILVVDDSDGDEAYDDEPDADDEPDGPDADDEPDAAVESVTDRDHSRVVDGEEVTIDGDRAADLPEDDGDADEVVTWTDVTDTEGDGRTR